MGKRKRNAGLITQLQEAIRTSGKSLYRVAKDSGVGAAQLGRFMSGKRGLSLDSLDKIFDALELQIVSKQTEPGDQPEPPPEKPGRRTRKGE